MAIGIVSATVDMAEFKFSFSGTDNPEEINMIVSELKTKGTQRALAKFIVFPLMMLACYLILIFYFRPR